MIKVTDKKSENDKKAKADYKEAESKLEEMLKNEKSDEFSSATFMDVYGGCSAIRYVQGRAREIAEAKPDHENPIKQAMLDSIEKFVKTPYLSDAIAFAINSYGGKELNKSDWEEVGRAYNKCVEKVRRQYKS